jgi:hypothetical protein
VSAYAILQVGRLPGLSLVSPSAGAAYTLADTIPLRASVTLGDRPLENLNGLRADAELRRGGRILAVRPLTPGPEGSFIGSIEPGNAAGDVDVAVTLSGAFEGTPLPPFTRSVRIRLTPRPLVELSWRGGSSLVVDPTDHRTLAATVRSSARTPRTIRLREQGGFPLTVNPGAWAIAPNRSDQTLHLDLAWTGVKPGDYEVALSGALDSTRTDFRGSPFRLRLHVRSWLEANGWWLYPALALLILLLLGGFFLAVWRARVWAERRKRMLDTLNRVEIALTFTNQIVPRKPLTTLPRNGFTVGGEGSDVLVVDEAEPTHPPFKEPRIRVEAVWDRKPVIRVRPVGSRTAFYNRDNRLITPPLQPTEGGEEFRVMPDNVTVRVSAF